jgi:hypothetical protein
MIQAVDEQHAVQAAQGDWLYLKGNAFPGLAGEAHWWLALTL